MTSQIPEKKTKKRKSTKPAAQPHLRKNQRLDPQLDSKKITIPAETPYSTTAEDEYDPLGEYLNILIPSFQWLRTKNKDTHQYASRRMLSEQAEIVVGKMQNILKEATILDKILGVGEKYICSSRLHFFAINNNNIDIIRDVISLGANVNLHVPERSLFITGPDEHENETQRTAFVTAYPSDAVPLHRALYFGRFDTAKLLISAGADVNYIDKNKMMTPIMLAANTNVADSTANQKFETVRLLVESRAEVNIITFVKDYSSPLRAAAIAGRAIL